MSKNHYQVGDHVFVLAFRSDTGCVCPPPESASAASCPIVECVVTHTSCGGVEGLYGLVWADSKEGTGLPWSGRSVFESREALKKRVESCQFPI